MNNLSLTALFLLLIISLSLMGLSVYLQLGTKQQGTIESSYELQTVLETEIKALIEQLQNDPTPEADSYHDPVWLWMEENNTDELTITLEDISSRFNLNFIRTKMLEESSLSSMMINNNTPEDIKLYRGEQGFFTDLNESYSDFFKEEDINKYFTSYSYANLNVSYEDSLKKLYEIRVGEAGANIFLTTIQNHIASFEQADDSKLNQILGSHKKDLYPLINVQPLLNVNYLDPLLLKAVLHYPYGNEKINNANEFEEILLVEREVMEVDQNRLVSLIEVEDQQERVLQYLGTKTWFWKIAVSQKNMALEAIICRLPFEDYNEIQFEIIQWKFMF